MFGKRQPVIIDIPQPCHQNWQQMLPEEKGRYCNSCQKTVTDFTTYTDQQIIEAIKQSNGPMCGRFLNTQLNRNLHQPVRALSAIRQSWLSKIAATVFMFGGMIQQLSAQQKANAITQHQTTTTLKPKPAADTTNIVIRGKVLNYYNNTPVGRIDITIANTGYVVTTDGYGRFKFELPPQFAKQTITLQADTCTIDFLDSTESLIQPVELYIDSNHFKTSVTLYRHPNEIVKQEIEVTKQYEYTLVGNVIAPQPTITFLELYPTPSEIEHVPPKKERKSFLGFKKRD